MNALFPHRVVRPAALLALALIPATGHAQGCDPEWLPTFGSLAGVGGSVDAIVSIAGDDGTLVYAGGHFATAGGKVVNGVASFDGSHWSALAGGLEGGDVLDLAWYEGGLAGPSLYAAGTFTHTGEGLSNHIARWNGQEWAPLSSGADGYVCALAVYQGALVAGGYFSAVGGLPAPGIARWNGSAWSTAAGGLSGLVLDLEVLDLGAGATLYASGVLTLPGVAGNVSVAAWDGSTWTALAGAADGPVDALEAFDGDLYAGGGFTQIDGVAASRIARWDGAAWSALGTGVSGGGDSWVRSLEVFADASGPRLQVGGKFDVAGGLATRNLAAWDGSAWSVPALPPTGEVRALHALDGEHEASLLVGASFHEVPLLPPATGTTPISGIAEWDGSTWAPLGDVHWASVGFLELPSVRAFEVYDDGAGPELYVAGEIAQVTSFDANSIMKWNGVQWAPLGLGVGQEVFALEVFDDGSGPALYAGGTFHFADLQPASKVARWKDGAWSPLGNGESECDVFDCGVRALLAFDDGSGPALFAAGDFTSLGGVAANRIARWDGATWTPLASGMNDTVHALAVFDDGAGPALYATGEFTTAGGATVNRIARWDGTSWEGVGGLGYPGAGRALTVFDDGSGPALYVGGTFDEAGGVATKGIARWDGTTWSAVGEGVFEVYALASVDQPPRLFAGGGFQGIGGAPVGHVAQWTGSAWFPLGSGADGDVHALAVFDDGAGPALYAGGSFSAVLDGHDGIVAKWGCWPSLQPIPGCASNPATLSALSKQAAIGEPLALGLAPEAQDAGLAVLFAGGLGVDAGGCGLALPGYGELLLAPAPAPPVVAQAPIAGGEALFLLAVPDQAALVGLELGAQAVGIAASPTLELSGAIAIRFTLF